MKSNLLLTALSTAMLTATTFAGGKTYVPSPAPPPPPPAFGTGWYFGLQAGVNAYQDFGADRDFNVGGETFRIENDSDIGFVGGIKGGYVFGTGTVRPAIEADLYYNGVRGKVDVTGGNADVEGSADFHSGAFMGNFLLRFAFDRFQPYVGAGAGVWIAEADDVELRVNGATSNFGDEAGTNGFAWQIIGGADYYFSEKFSVFAEYKYLNYEDAGLQSDTIDQHLVVLGVRLHF